MMNETTVTWKINHIPDKPPTAPDQQPTVTVVASVVEPKHANTLIRRLNQIAPLEDLRHVKRIQRTHVEGGKTQLSVILCVASEHESQLHIMPEDVQELVNSYQLSPFITKVCKYAAASREEWEEQLKLWPTSFHPPTYNIDGITGFSEECSLSILSFMKMAIHLAKCGGGSMVNAAVIVDPLAQQIIASGCDQICAWHPPSIKKNFTRNRVVKEAEDLSAPNSNGITTCESVVPNNLPYKAKRSHICASCLNPWDWSEQQMDMASLPYWHPLQHAAIVAIESSADRDRRLFPGSVHPREKSCEESVQSSHTNSAVKRQKTNLENVWNEKQSHAYTSEDSLCALERPYLCTGYDIYLVWEPCTMCAMALVHQRIRRIFYAFPNRNAGALGSVHRLQGEESLNHHYAVFRVFVPEEFIETD